MRNYFLMFKFEKNSGTRYTYIYDLYVYEFKVMVIKIRIFPISFFARELMVK